MNIKNRFPLISISFIILILTIVSSNLNWGNKQWKGILEADAKGYYAYLPAVFIYQDLNFGFFDKIEKEKYFNENLFYNYRTNYKGNYINKYYCGTAIAQLPFFLIAHTISSFTTYDSDGYSKPFMLLVNIAAIFYLLIALIFISKLLGLYNISIRNQSIVLFSIVFGTNIFYYTVVESGMTHIYSLAFVSMFLFYTKHFIKSPKYLYIYKLAALFGIIVLIRPINGLIIFIIPFLAENRKSFIDGIKYLITRKLKLLFCFCISLLIISIQFIIYKISTDHFFVYSYINEGFNFIEPHMIDILFSYKKGLFLYTPLLLLSMIGGYFLWKRNKFEFYSIFIFLFIITYFLSSWWNWWYGGSFSSRVYIEYIPLFAVLLAITLENIKNLHLKKVYLLAILLLVIVCQIQTYQYRYYQIHWEETTKEKYWEVFLRIDKLI